jgi:hypothetical protein
MTSTKNRGEFAAATPGSMYEVKIGCVFTAFLTTASQEIFVSDAWTENHSGMQAKRIRLATTRFPHKATLGLSTGLVFCNKGTWCN